ncbi:MAG: CHAT domain-containing protein [Balneolia bacterium]|nr:CHAT domain-containing protein [Balneolia bacterium]
MDYAKALRKARLEMISRPGFNHPYQWASFILTGI